MIKKKKIGLITWYGSKNYGTCLQAYALYHKINKIGYDCRIIKPFKYIPYVSLDIINIFRLTKNFIYERIFNNARNNVMLTIGAKPDIQQLRIAKLNHDDLSFEMIKTEIDYKRVIQDYDVFITGSDQIWNPYYTDPFYMLNFAPYKRKIAYSTSIGVSEIPKNKVKIYKKYLSKFSYLGMREKVAVEIIQNLLPNKDVCKVLDPTFLLSSEDWEQFGNEGENDFTLPENYILCYLIGQRDEYKVQISDILNRSEIKKLIVLKSAENGDLKVENGIKYSNAGPKEFIKLLSHASLIITDSFHATAISINMSKQFIEFLRFNDTDEKSQNSRIYELLEHYQLEDRLYQKEIDVEEKIHYEPVQTILEEDRKQSLSYLTRAIENEI